MKNCADWDIEKLPITPRIRGSSIALHQLYNFIFAILSSRRDTRKAFLFRSDLMEIE
jgi:hypothetical protein